MDLQKLTVGQMAQLNHVSRQTLRLYDKEGLLRPLYTDEITGYRYYHILQSARLDFIQTLKVYGMTLREIREILERNRPEELRAILTRQAGEMAERIRQLQLSQAAILRALDSYSRFESMPRGGEVFLEFIQERHLFRCACGVNYFDQGQDGYEYMLRQLKNSMAEHRIPLSYFTNTGTIIRKEDLLQGRLYSDEVFIFLDDDSIPDLETVPAATYLCLCSDQLSQEEENARCLLQYAEDHGYLITGDYLCEVVVDIPILQSFARGMYYKIQIPVRHYGESVF